MKPLGPAFVALTLLGCDGTGGASTAASASPSASAASVPVASGAASARPARPAAPLTLAGTWSGSYEAQRYAIEMSKEEGMVRQWHDDDGKRHAGDGTLTLTIDEHGKITGSASGPLGEQVISGATEGDKLTAQLAPAKPKASAFSGTLSAKLAGDKLSGSLQMSSGDSLTVRDAPVSLARAGAQTAAPAAPSPAPSASAP